MTQLHSHSFWSAVLRGAQCRCPNCGKGRLFTSYLKQVPQCSVCGEMLGHIRADDGPSWLTILLVGHILAPFILIIAPNTHWPDWVSMVVWLSAALILTLTILPRAKGVFIGIIWRSGCSGADK